jgi:hypothetical protein
VDGQRFDDLTQRLTSLLSRRRFGQALATLGMAGVLGSAPAAQGKKKKCKKPRVKCGKKCVDPKTNPSHCGNCTTACGTGQSCVGGTCVSTSGCNPPCPSDRPCSGGKCTCSTDQQCARDRDPDGFQCLNSVTNPFCGCRKASPTDEYPRVCVAGEPCSFCCSDLECQAANPDLPDIVCTTLPVNGLVGRACCVPKDGLCGGNNQCCGGGCVGNACGCIGAGNPCGAHEQCCSNQCGTQANPFTCM